MEIWFEINGFLCSITERQPYSESLEWLSCFYSDESDAIHAPSINVFQIPACGRQASTQQKASGLRMMKSLF
jgi:hypothetical protein